jgi:hypothetical protein
MKQQLYRILIGAAFLLANVSTSQAMSFFVSLSVEPEWPATPTPGNVVVYKVNAVVREGSGLLEVALSSLGLPEGATVELSPSVLRFTGNYLTNQTATMTVTCPQVMPTDTYPFSVTGTSKRESKIINNVVTQEIGSPIVGAPVLAIDHLSSGGLRLRGKGTTGMNYTIEASPTLTNPTWTAVGSSTADGNGRFTFFPAKVLSTGALLFRAVEVKR